MRGKDLTVGLVVALGPTQTRRAIVLDSRRIWREVGATDERGWTYRPVGDAAGRWGTKAGYAVAVEAADGSGWRPKVVPARQILRIWTDHLAILAEIEEREAKAEAGRAEQRAQAQADARRRHEEAQALGRRLEGLGLSGSVSVAVDRASLPVADLLALLDAADLAAARRSGPLEHHPPPDPDGESPP